jgi:twitching motility two-component system response regulator PilG
VLQARSLELLREGIAAARAGDKGRTRRLLREATGLDPSNELAWLWLAGVAESPQEGVACLERVLALNPANERARAGIHSVRLQAGLAEAKAGNKPEARRHLREVTRYDSTNELAWLCLAGVAESPQEALAALERVLKINPGNEKARQGVRYYQAQLAPPKPAWHCPVCETGMARAPSQCSACGALVNLSNLDAFFRNGSVDASQLEAARGRWEGALEERTDYVAHYNLGLVHANARRFEDALSHFQEASRLRTSDRALRTQVAGLAQRLLAARQKEAEKPPPRGCVMVVDDSATVRKLVTLTLEKHGFHVYAATGGYEAVKLISEQRLPDLILLDITMPEMDGYQICKFIKQNRETRRVPVVMLSGKDGFFDKLRGRFAGSNDYITKPFKAEDLLRVAERYCPRAAPAVRNGKPK